MTSGLYRRGDRFYGPEFELYADRRVLEKGHADQVHWHDYCEVELIISGRGWHEMNGCRYPLHEHCVYLITPMDFHAVSTLPQESIELYHVQFGCSVLSSESMQRLTRASAGGMHGIAAEPRGVQQAQIRSMFEEILEEFSVRREDSPAMLRACLERLCLLILRQVEPGEKEPAGIQRADEHAAINEAIQYMQYNFRSPISLADIARRVHLSDNYFGELFRARLGMSLHEYLRKLRLSYACRLLVETELSVSEIAKESGFRSLSYFAEIFKAAYGAAPTVFRKEKHSKEEKI